MSTQVTAALVSGGAALTVALLGIAGAIAAQFVATKRGFANSQALLERQFAQTLALAEQERGDRERMAQQERAARQEEWLEQLHREDFYRYSEQRRSIYARFLRSVRETADANFRVLNDIPPEGEVEEERMARRGPVLREADECAARLGEVGAELEMLASSAVFAAAADLTYALGNGDESEYGPARKKFLLEVRRELGVAGFRL